MPRKTHVRQFAALAAACAGAISSPGSAQVTAFPGADGAAAMVTGGRGGIVYHVTQLNMAIDDPARNDPGTLRYGLNNANFPAGPRTIVFDVAGVFNMGRLPQPANNNWQPNGNGWDTQSRLDIPSNITLAGQTAPGRVIITGGVIKPGGVNQIIRNITVAPGYGQRNFYQPGATGPATNDFPDSYVYDAFDISGQNIMIDHVSMLYATDETVSANELANNVTIQYSNISQGQNYPQADAEAGSVTYTGHGLGSLLQAGTSAKISVHHNLYAHQKGRLPRVGSEVGTGAHNDFRNNVFYNWFGTGGGGASGQPSFNKFVGNFWLAGNGGDDVSQTAGPDGIAGNLDDIGVVINRSGGTGIFNGSNSSGTRVYHAGNLKDTNRDGDANDGVALANSDFGSSAFVSDASFSIPYLGTTDTAAAAYERVLNYMGANWWLRDGVIDTPDERIIHEARTGTGKIMAWADDPFNPDPTEGVEWRALNATPQTNRPANFDVDQDGLPGAWELTRGLNPFAPSDAGDFDNDGYTNLEEYLNELAAFPAPGPLVFNGLANTRYEDSRNWTALWQPSRYDTAVIAAGTVTLDSVGQDAGTLQINTGATLHITAGWIAVGQRVQIGNAGTLLVNGGSFSAPLLALNGGGTARLAAGANTTPRVGEVQAATGKLDLGDNALIIDYVAASPADSVRQLISSARGGGTWTGFGIGSSAADAASFAVGYGEASDVLGVSSGQVGNFRGQLVDSTSLLILFTRYGDANLNRVVDIDDFGVLAAAFNTTGGWSDGDFDYSGTVDIDDFGLLAANFNQSVAAPLGSRAVPEPAGLLVTLPLILRRRLRR